eukprot:snap_masked-scaffold_49-processed-gene-1.68-mRNA-1 protein AED:1.00 eAED:1.00 QI:0/-1/0/0/-1/1/1/0/339
MSNPLPVGSYINNNDTRSTSSDEIASARQLQRQDSIFIQANTKGDVGSPETAQLCYNTLYFLFVAAIVVINIFIPGNLAFVLPFVALVSILMPYCITSFDAHPLINSQTKYLDVDEVQDKLETLTGQEPTLEMTLKGFKTTSMNRGATVTVLTFTKKKKKDFLDWFDSSPEQSFTVKNKKFVKDFNEKFQVENIAEEGNLNKIVRLEIKQKYDLLDEETKQNFSHQKAELINEYATAEEEYEYTEKYYVKGVPKYIIIENDTSSWVDFLFSSKLYLCCVVFGCAFCFRKLISYLYLENYVWTNKKTLSANQLDDNILTQEEIDEVDVIDGSVIDSEVAV